jgi:hypothetical protein
MVHQNILEMFGEKNSISRWSVLYSKGIVY